MLDWSDIFNILFVAAALALTVFFLVSTLVVAVKGKRKCNAFDVILRILASLAMLGSAAMFVCAVLTMLSGGLCITVSGKSASLVFSGKTIELPMPELFVALSSAIGLMLSALLFICSIAALIVDCLVANKKDPASEKAQKHKKQNRSKAPQKTPEQLKLEADLERIRRLGESAVSKTNAAARHAEDATAKREQEREEPIASDGEQELADWRAEPENDKTDNARSAEFVGIKQTADEFDTFDDFGVDGSDGDTKVSDVADDDNAVSEENTSYAEPAAADAAFDDSFEDAEDAAQSAEPEENEAHYHDDGAELDSTDVSEDISDDNAFDDDKEQADDDDMSAWAYDSDRNSEPSANDDEYALDSEDEDLGGTVNDDKVEDDGIEPDRDIYIPNIRTIVRPSDRSAPAPAPKPKATAASARAQKPRRNSESKQSARPNASSGGAAKKPTKTAQSRSSQRTEVAPEKKLPVTRRYVILDRQNAVNMFGEYLKERDRAAKDKLQSSINTIIIE